ncbi:unnamed protein product [Rotaria sp. Silwood1]|nr:unnamed protein product [Rotaria sp. Silwood1]CAF1642285.1 unnamed protein product [Rotaria sp. Silwood1]
MKEIVAATERNDRFQSDSYGKRLIQLTTAAKSNLNIDLYNLDVEIQHQFGLHSVEVTGDGVCAFQTILISGMLISNIPSSSIIINEYILEI